MGRSHPSEGFPFETDLHTAEMRPNPEGINIRVERIPTHVEHRRQRLSEQFFQSNQPVVGGSSVARSPHPILLVTAILASPATLFNPSFDPSLPNDREVRKVSQPSVVSNRAPESTGRAVVLS